MSDFTSDTPDDFIRYDGPGRPSKPVIISVTNRPLPPVKKREVGKVKAEIFAAIGQLAVNECMEINRSLHGMKLYVYRYRKLMDSDARFILRKGPQPQTTRIWRVK